jgi:crotonyl-CoA reductase
MTGLAEAAMADASPEELLDCELPRTYVAAHLLRDDVEMFGDAADRDVRKSIRIGEVPLPELAPDETLIAVMASAINFNTVWSAMFLPVPTFQFLEQMGREGGWYARHDQPYHVLGSDAAGIVVRVGSGVRKWSVGDRVVVSVTYVDDQDPHAAHGTSSETRSQLAWGFETNFGGLAHFAIAKANQLMPKPRHLSWEEAACNALCGMTAYRMLVSHHGARLKQGDIALIWGATGGLGSYAVQYVCNGGGIAVGVVSSERKAQLAEKLGCDLVLRRDELELDGLDWHAMGKRVGAEIRRHIGEDPHIVFDYLGRATFPASVFIARTGGCVVTCGSSTGYWHEYDNRYLWMKLKRIIGSHGAAWNEAWDANRLIDQGKVVPPLSRVFPLEQTGEATRVVQLNRHVGKIGVLCLAESEGLGIEDPDKREKVGEERLKLFRGFS